MNAQRNRQRAKASDKTNSEASDKSSTDATDETLKEKEEEDDEEKSRNGDLDETAEQEIEEAIAGSLKPARRFQGRGARRDLSLDRKRLMSQGNVGNRPALAPIYKETQALGGILSEVPEFYGEGGETYVAEVAVQFLNAQVRVLKDELQRVIQDCVEKEEQIAMLEKKAKDVEQDRTKIMRDMNTKQALAEKFQRISDDAKARCDKLEAQNNSLKKEVDILRHGQKQVAVTKGTIEVRLNRALEETEKYKSELRQIRHASKESIEADKKKIDELSTDNKRLEKQKTELLTAFKKQMKLIDNLKKQKMHLEAAKALQFTEEEFMRAIEWGS